MSSVIVWLMSQCIWIGLECYRGVRNGLPLPLDVPWIVLVCERESRQAKKILGKFLENIQPQKTILKLLSVSLKNSFQNDWIYGGRSRTATACEMGFFVSNVHGCQPLITIAKTSSVLNIVVIVDVPLYVNILGISLHVLQILNNL